MSRIILIAALIISCTMSAAMYLIDAKQIEFLQAHSMEVNNELVYTKNALEICKEQINHTDRVISHSVTATCYHAVPEQTNADYTNTADMTKIDTTNPLGQRILAVSRDLLDKVFNMGDTVIVTGTNQYDGIWYIHDKMNKRFTNKIDFLVNLDSPIDLYQNVTIFKIYKTSNNDN